jgi:hypothetical protein
MKLLILITLSVLSLNIFAEDKTVVGENKTSKCIYAHQTDKREDKPVIDNGKPKKEDASAAIIKSI